MEIDIVFFIAVKNGLEPVSHRFGSDWVKFFLQILIRVDF